MTATTTASAKAAPERPPAVSPGQLHRRRGRREGVPRLRCQRPPLQLLHAGQAQADPLRGRHRRGAAGSAALPVAGLDLRLRRRADRLPADLDQAQGLGGGRPGAGARDRDRRRRQGLDWPAHGWHEFRDPNEEWEQTIYRNNANVVRQLNQNIENARNAKSFEQWTRNWITFVQRSVGAWMHVEHILGLYVFGANERSCPTNMHNTVLAVNSAHKIRFAQDLALYNLTLSEEIEELRRRRPRRRLEQRPRVAGGPRGHRGADRDPGRLGRGHVRHERHLRATDR